MPARTPVGWFDSPAFDQHVAPSSHPERPDRLIALRKRLRDSGLDEKLERRVPREVSEDAALRVHSQEYLLRLRSMAEQGGGYLDADTYVSRHSERAARLAAGAVEQAVEEVVTGKLSRALCTVRPPGHHARATTGMGFCLLNNVAIGAEAAFCFPTIDRVAIFDWDVHHGNGTEEIFYERGDVFYASTHQVPAYPGTGAAHDRGTGPGQGTTLNVPLKPGASDQEILAAWDEQIEAPLCEFAPQLLLISAGFDAAGRDPLASLEVTTNGFRQLSEKVVSFAERMCGGRVISVLEGGYDTAALADDVQAHVETLIA